MRKLFISFFCACVMFANNSSLYGQENLSRINLSVDVASGFVWRGLPLNTSPVVQPSFTFTPGKFSIGTWATSPFVSGWDQYQEIDLFVNYQFTPSFSISITDYYAYDNFWNFSERSYFNYKKEETGHAFDLQLIYGGTDRFPLKMMGSVIFAGNDLNDEGKNNFSTYIELGYGNTCRDVDWEIFAGGVPMASDFYGITGANVINLGVVVSKSFEITPTYSLPLSVKFTVNPAMEVVFLSAAITLF